MLLTVFWFLNLFPNISNTCEIEVINISKFAWQVNTAEVMWKPICLIY